MADSDERQNVEVFDSILRFCRTRILKRIGSQRSEILPLYMYALRPVAFLGSSLKMVSDVVASGIPHGRRNAIAQGQRLIKKTHISTAQSFVDLSRNLGDFLNELEICDLIDVDQKLKQVIWTASRLLGKMEHMPRLLRHATNRDLQPGIYQGVKTRLEELARIGQFSDDLFELGKSNSLFRNVRVVSISLDWDHLHIPTTKPSSFSLESCVVRCSQDKSSMFRLCEYLNKPLAEASSAFSIAAHRNIMESKMHAEIQILVYYYLVTPQLRPRIFGSSKDPCYLCNMVIGLDGRFGVLGTSGRLHPRWKLPSMPVFDDLWNKTNNELESKISMVTKQGLSTPELSGTDLDRSHLVPLPLSTNPYLVHIDTSQSLPAASDTSVQLQQEEPSTGGDRVSIPEPVQVVAGVELKELALDYDDDDSDESSLQHLNGRVHGIATVGVEVPNQTEILSERNLDDLIGSADDDSDVDVTPLAEKRVSQHSSSRGIVVRLRHTPGERSPDHIAKLLKMFTAFVCEKGSELKLGYLTDEEAREVAEGSEAPTMDIEPMEEVDDLELPGGDCILLKCGEDMIRMSVGRS